MGFSGQPESPLNMPEYVIRSANLGNVRLVLNDDPNIYQLTTNVVPYGSVDTFIEVGYTTFNKNRTLIAKDATIKEYVLSAGFTNVINANDVVGDTWTFSNGNYIDNIVLSGSVLIGTYHKSDSTIQTNYPIAQGLTSTSTGGVVSEILGLSNSDLAGVLQNYGITHQYPIGYNVYTVNASSLTVTISTFRYGGTYTRAVPGYTTYTTDDIAAWFYDFWVGISPTPTDSDPFIPGGENEPGGGGGDFDDPSEDVTDPAVPDVSAVDTGFITIFNPSISQLNSLASYMWSAGFDLDTFKKMFANPMDCILGLSMLPKIVPAGGSRNVTVGNISTGVSMTVAASQFVKFDCGSVTVKRYSNSFLDYAPYTKVSIYLPFVGIHELSVDDVMNKSVHVKYNIDILSGACAAFVICGGTTLYTYTGQCAASIPVTSGDWSTMINGVIGAVGGAIKAAVGGAAMGGLVGAVGAGAASLASSAMDVAGMKPSIEHSGNMGGMGGMMGVKTPFLIITRPQQAIPGQQNKYTGYPAFITKELNELEGYTEIEEIHLENIPATENEITEIYNLLKSGVIL